MAGKFSGKLRKQDEPTPIYEQVKEKARETPIHDEVVIKTEEKK